MSIDAGPEPGPSDLSIDWEPSGRNGTVNLRVHFGRELIFADKIDLSRDGSRKRFVERLCEQHEGIDSAEVEARLLAILPDLERRKAGRRAEALEPPDRPAYFARDNCLHHRAEGRDGPVEVRLCNFAAEIAVEVVRDDGDEQFRSFRVVGTLCDGRPLSAEVPSAKFSAMDWVVEQFGAEAIIEAGRGVRDHARAAIQHLSNGIERRTTFAHTGWRLVDGEWAYLHSGGAIGEHGLDPGVSVNLGKALKNYELPPPPEGEDLVIAVRASLGLLRLAQPGRPSSLAVAAAAICYPYRAAIGRAGHSGQYNGLTGSHKTCLAALSLQHFGARMNYRDGMPANWDSTANRLEWMMHAAKDALLVIDDFVPGGSAHDVARAHKDAERVLRSQGNGRGRERLGPDGRARPSKPPRGVVISTGEDRVRRKSANARTLPVRFVREDPDGEVLGAVDKAVLAACQADADSGLYAASMSGFVRWLAPRYPGVRDDIAMHAANLRPLATLPGCHARTPDIVADLAAAFDVFLEFAVEVGAVAPEEARRHREAVWDGLMEAAAPSPDEEGSNAGETYIRLLAAALGSCQAYLVNARTGEAPDGLESACGWRMESSRPSGHAYLSPGWSTAPSAIRVGWTDGDLVFLEPDAAFQVAQKMATAQGEAFPVQKANVHAQLDESGKLARKDTRNGKESRNRLTSRESLERRQRNALVLRADEFWGVEDETADLEREGAIF